MLCLSRRPGETIVVGDVVFKVVEIRGGRVRVAVDAPQEVQIRRGELDANGGSAQASDPAEISQQF